VELLGGIAVLLGAFVRFASVPMAIVLLVAMFTVHLPYGFSSIKLLEVTPAGAKFGPPGYETVRPPGRWSMVFYAQPAAHARLSKHPFDEPRQCS
jgi:hypothetical protein